VCYAANCDNKVVYQEKKTVTVSGLVRKVRFWGPPEFGDEPKTDEQYTGIILYLDCPIYIPKEYNINDYYTNVNMMVKNTNMIVIKGRNIVVINVRVEGDDKQWTDYRLHDGWRAKITGILEEGTIASDHTAITISDVLHTKWLSPPKRRSSSKDIK